jgi:hypothetical protein
MAETMRSYWDVVEPVFKLIDLRDQDSFFSTTAVMPRPVVLLYAAHFCLSELHNGGFLQFFWNSTGLIAPEAADGFIAIGMPKLASLLLDTAAPLGSPYPRDRDARWDALLMASGRGQHDLESIFKGSSNMYLAFEEATEPLRFDESNRQAWELAKSENGGFGEAATRYARSANSIRS